MYRKALFIVASGMIGWVGGGIIGDIYRLNRERRACQDPHCDVHKT